MVMMRDRTAKWKIAEAKQRLSEVIRAAEEEPQLIFNRDRLVAAVVQPNELEEFLAWRREVGRQSLFERFAELRQICDEESYSFDAAPRVDRPNPFADARAPSLRHQRPQ